MIHKLYKQLASSKLANNNLSQSKITCGQMESGASWGDLGAILGALVVVLGLLGAILGLLGGDLGAILGPFVAIRMGLLSEFAI